MMDNFSPQMAAYLYIRACSKGHIPQGRQSRTIFPLACFLAWQISRDTVKERVV
jgi:hypothetical protein